METKDIESAEFLAPSSPLLAHDSKASPSIANSSKIQVLRDEKDKPTVSAKARPKAKTTAGQHPQHKADRTKGSPTKSQEASGFHVKEIGEQIEVDLGLSLATYEEKSPHSPSKKKKQSDKAPDRMARR